MTARSEIDGRTVIFKEDQWVFEDDGEPAPTPEKVEEKETIVAHTGAVGKMKKEAGLDPSEPILEEDCDEDVANEADDPVTPVYCERCGWKGYTGDLKGKIGNCPECGSTWEITEVARDDPKGGHLCDTCEKDFATCDSNPTFETEGVRDTVTSCPAYMKDPSYGQKIIADPEETPPVGSKRFSETFADNIDIACIHADPENWPCQWLDLDIGCTPDCEHREHRKPLTLEDVSAEVLDREGIPIMCPGCSATFADHIARASPSLEETCPACGDATLEPYP